MKSRYYPIIESYDFMCQEILENYPVVITLEADTTAAANTNTGTGATTTKQATGSVKSGETQNFNNAASKASVDTVSAKNTASDGTSKVAPAKKKTLVDTISNFLSQIAKMIERITMFIQNRMSLLLQSDKTFFKTLNSRKNTVKPLNSFKATNYSYNAKEADRIINTLGTEINNAIKTLSNVNTVPSNSRMTSIVGSDIDHMTSIILSNYVKGKDGESTTMKDFTSHLIDTFRGEKKEFVYQASSIPQIMTIAQSTSNITDTINAKLKTSQANLTNLKRLKSIAAQEEDDKKLEEMVKRFTKATQLYNIYLTALKVYHELLLERSLSARELLRKFYQF